MIALKKYFWIPALLLTFAYLGRLPLFDPDEPRYAQASREMMERGDWINPTLNHEDRWDKPILFYWLVLLSYQLFGVSEWSARFPSAVFCLLCILMLYFWLKKNGRPFAALASLVLMSNLEFLILGRLCVTDMTLCFFKSGSLILFFEAWKDKSKTLYLSATVMSALGVLTKGPVALFIPMIIIIFFLTVTSSWGSLAQVPWLRATGLFCLIGIPWYVAESILHPGFFEYFFIRHNVKRFATAELKHTEPFYYYLWIIAAGFFPWSLYLPRAIKRSLNILRSDPLILLCIIWIGVEVLFFTLAKAKLPTYILSIFLPMSVLVARLWEQDATEGSWKWEARWALVLSLAGLLTGGVLWSYHFPMNRLLFVRALALILLVFVLGWLGFILRQKTREFAAVFCLFIAIYTGLGLTLSPVFAQMRSLKSFADIILDQGVDQSRVFSFQIFKPSLVFYLNRRIENPKSPSDLGSFFEKGGKVFGIFREDWWQQIQTESFIQGAKLLASSYGKVLIVRDKLEGQPGE